MCEEESEDHEAVAKLFEINDSIHRTIERYKLFKKGDIEGANKIPKGTLGKSGAGVTKGADNSLNLIDFGDTEPTQAPTPSGSTVPEQPKQPALAGTALEDDLLGLSLGSSSYGQSGGISLGGSNGSGKYYLKIIRLRANAFTVLGLSGVPVPKPQQTQPSQAINDIFGALPNSGRSQLSSPQPYTSSQSSSQQTLSTPDPFAALTSSTPRQASPFQFQQSINPQSSSSASGSVDLLGVGTSTASPNLAQSSTPATGPANDDDEWTFTSAVPDTSKEITVVNTSVKILFTVSRESDTVVLIRSRISNNTPAPISELTFQSAVSKVCSITSRCFTSSTIVLPLCGHLLAHHADDESARHISSKWSPNPVSLLLPTSKAA
jgi:hypothetical protein